MSPRLAPYVVNLFSNFSGMPNLIGPIDPRLVSTGQVFVANQMRTCRVVVPKDGEIRDVSVWIVAQSGNIALAVYDTNDASAGNRTQLWSSGSVACGGATAWQTIDPGAGTVKVKAGQLLDFAVVADNATASIGRTATFASGINQLPTNFAIAPGGASPKVATTVATAFPPPSTIAEASLVANNNVPVIIARIA